MARTQHREITPDGVTWRFPNPLRFLKSFALRILLYAFVPASMLSAPTHAALMTIEGTVSLNVVASVKKPVRISGTGVADVNPGGPDFALNTLDLAGGITGSVGIPVTDPEVTATIASIRWDAALGTGSLGPFAAQSPLTRNTLPLRGSVRVCLVTANCSSEINIPLTQGSGSVGVGVGGHIDSEGSGPLVAVSVETAPWTLGSAYAPISTLGGATLSIPSSGFVHGAFSFTASAALAGGEIKLVSPVIVRSAEGIHPLTSFATMNIRLVPEPGVGLLLLAGVVGLLVLGRGRIVP